MIKPAMSRVRSISMAVRHVSSALGHSSKPSKPSALTFISSSFQALPTR